MSTLLALMDGMDNRGQVIVIGATNRPDSIDPAFRRPGRFDREFYFALPNKEARRKILEIHTRGWEPPLKESLKDDLAEATNGYGGSDLRALCTEAALNAVQRHYPQIYKSNEKLLIRPETIKVTGRDFMMSIKKLVPSSERSVSSGAKALPKNIQPLLQSALHEVVDLLEDILPRKKSLTALEEAEFEDAVGDHDMRTEMMQQDFEASRVFRPRLLLRGLPGMGQQYLAAAILHHFEGYHVQSFDLSILRSDLTRSVETVIAELFTEVRRHKPSIVFIPNVDTWYSSIEKEALAAFINLLRRIPPTDPVLLLGFYDCPTEDVDHNMVRDLFGFTKINQYEVSKPTEESRLAYFKPLMDYINTPPESFPDPADRKKRELETLPPAPAEPAQPARPPTKEELRKQNRDDRYVLGQLKRRIQPIMDQIKQKYKKFRTGVIEDSQFAYLFDENDPTAIVQSDMPNIMRAQTSFRPYEKAHDDHGEVGLLEVQSGKFFYNMESVTIEKRLSNGYYKRPRDFLADIKKLTKDARAIGDPERLLKANELENNVELDMRDIEVEMPLLVTACEGVYQREKAREKQMMERARQAAEASGRQADPFISNLPPEDSGSGTQNSGAIILGQPTNGLHGRLVNPPTSAAAEAVPETTSPLTNGHSGASDLSKQQQGSSNDTNGQQDVRMGNNDDEGSSTPVNERYQPSAGPSFGQSAQIPPGTSLSGTSSLQDRLSQHDSVSQRSAVMPVAPGAPTEAQVTPASTRNSGGTKSSSNGVQGTSEHQEDEMSLLFSHQPLRNMAASVRERLRALPPDKRSQQDITQLLLRSEHISELSSTQEGSFSPCSSALSCHEPLLTVTQICCRSPRYRPRSPCSRAARAAATRARHRSRARSRRCPAGRPRSRAAAICATSSTTSRPGPPTTPPLSSPSGRRCTTTSSTTWPGPRPRARSSSSSSCTRR